MFCNDYSDCSIHVGDKRRGEESQEGDLGEGDTSFLHEEVRRRRQGEWRLPGQWKGLIHNYYQMCSINSFSNHYVSNELCLALSKLITFSFKDVAIL